jgi:ketosteroid isomerase-like protein
MCSSFSVVFRFSPDSLTWVVSRGKKVLSRHCRKRDAVREAARLARASGRAKLTVERVDGSVQCVRHYGRTIPRDGDGRAPADGDSVTV